MALYMKKKCPSAIYLDFERKIYVIAFVKPF